jgi:protein subunit release factor A
MRIKVAGQALRITYRPFNSGGKGGQHANKTMNAVECTVTLPDGRIIRATSQTSKSQHMNKKLAEKVLASRVRVAYAPIKTRGIGGLERTRTYNAMDDRVIDHASGLRRSYREVLKGGDAFADLVDARREAMELKKALED